VTWRRGRDGGRGRTFRRMPPPEGQLQPLRCVGRDGVLIVPSQLTTRNAVRQIVFFGAHLPVSREDAYLFRWRAAQMPRYAEIWLLLLDETSDPHALDQAANLSRATRAASCLWNASQVFNRLPQFASALKKSPAYVSEWDPHLKRYYWMHTSLLLWNDTLAHAYPRYKYVWRIEPDVMYSGNMSSLLQQSSKMRTDVVLPRYIRKAWDDEVARVRQIIWGRKKNFSNPNVTYYHWKSHADVLSGIKQQVLVRSLVSIGRYSRRFLDLLYNEYWRPGIPMYEEILLPLACFKAGYLKCLLGSWSSNFKGLAHVTLATHFRFKPSYFHEDFLDALQADTGEIWHPIKKRSHVAMALGFSNGSESMQPSAPWPPKLNRQARPPSRPKKKRLNKHARKG